MPSQTSKRDQGQIIDSEILAALDHPVKVPRASFLYSCALAIVAFAMILLPLAYLGLIAAIGYGVYYHFAHSGWMTSRTGGSRVRAFLFVAPGLIGLTMIGFMLKPFFAPRKCEETGMIIDESQEPLLVAYIEKLARMVGARTPHEIRVDCDANASASFHRGMWGFLTGRLTLQIGMPLVAGLTLTELTGVLAHELGHFTQGVAMRLSYVIRSLNHWLARIVYERDRWDEQLDGYIREGGWIGLVFMLASFMIWITRRILWLFMWIAHGLSCTLMRQMEYNADAVEAATVGADVFEGSCIRLAEISASNSFALSQLSRSWQDRRLVDDFPLMVGMRSRTIPTDVQQRIRAADAESKTKLFDTHPSTNDRRKAVRAADHAGVLRSDRPASDLFHNFEVTSRAATLVFYRQQIDPGIGATNLISSSRALENVRQESAERDAVEKFLGHRLSTARLVFFDATVSSSGKDRAAKAAKLTECRKRIEAALPNIRSAYEAFGESSLPLRKLATARSLIAAGLPVDPQKFGIEAANFEAVHRAQIALEKKRDTAIPVLNSYEKVLCLRVALGLELIQAPEGSTLVASAKEDVERVLNVLNRLRDVLGRWDQFQGDVFGFRTSAEYLDAPRTRELVIPMLLERLNAAAEFVRDARSSLTDVEYPFDHASGRVSVATALLPSLPSIEQIAASMDAINRFESSVLALYVRLVGRLTWNLLRVEKGLGMTPFPDEPASSVS